MAGLAADLALALELADLADAVALRHFRRADLASRRKPDRSLVSAVDVEAEEALRRHLGRRRPADAVVGEELGGPAAGEARRRWLLDPLDHTANFVRGVPAFASLVALEDDGEVTVGVVSAPALGSRWWAARGAGAFADGRRIAVSAVSRLDEAHVSFAAPLHRWAGLGRLEGGWRSPPGPASPTAPAASGPR